MMAQNSKTHFCMKHARGLSRPLGPKGRCLSLSTTRFSTGSPGGHSPSRELPTLQWAAVTSGVPAPPWSTSSSYQRPSSSFSFSFMPLSMVLSVPQSAPSLAEGLSYAGQLPASSHRWAAFSPSTAKTLPPTCHKPL